MLQLIRQRQTRNYALCSSRYPNDLNTPSKHPWTASSTCLKQWIYCQNGVHEYLIFVGVLEARRSKDKKKSLVKRKQANSAKIRRYNNNCCIQSLLKKMTHNVFKYRWTGKMNSSKLFNILGEHFRKDNPRFKPTRHLHSTQTTMYPSKTIVQHRGTKYSNGPRKYYLLPLYIGQHGKLDKTFSWVQSSGKITLALPTSSPRWLVLVFARNKMNISRHVLQSD